MLLDLPDGLNLLLEDGQGGPAPLQEARTGLEKNGARSPAPGAAHLLVQGDVVEADALFSGEVVGAVVAVLQQRPAVRRAGAGAARVPRTPQPQQAAGRPQPLRAGVVIIQKAWRRGGVSQTGAPAPGARSWFLPWMETLTLSKSWLLGSFQVSKFHWET